MSEPDVFSRFSGRLIPEKTFAGAYESTSPALRALCKHALAAQYALFGEAPEQEERSFLRCAQDMHAHRRIRPVDWALFVFDEDYASAPRLAAALMPALLAHVPLTAVICLGRLPRPELLCALELTGVEQVYALNVTQSMEALDSLVVSGADRGRLVLLHRGSLDALSAASRAAGVNCLEERHPPVVRIDGDEIDADLVRLAHPDAVFAPADAPCDAAYKNTEGGRFSAPLTFCAGMEGCWVHPGLTPDFFRSNDLLLAPCNCRQAGRFKKGGAG